MIRSDSRKSLLSPPNHFLRHSITDKVPRSLRQMSGSTQPQLRHDITPHLPKDKLDYESVEALLNYPNPADPVPLIPSLLEWLQDVNWPIFTPVSMVLLRSLADLIAPVRQVLRGDDDEWVYNVIAHLMPLMEREILCQLKEDVLDVRRRVKQGILSPDWDWEVEVDLVLEKMQCSADRTHVHEG
ncbi:hypothetical protein FIBSPDRAFT_492127 [Athelia psychrophila]|uniref:DUF5071 domain-containing protein n=1 Tax=Athelia psychrophila TaxID=1759441 RepID=A0A166KP67_9AGAM|nr:hypothetical protein FIBSPDRAFT_492127 [Fibularhizoctonia sp. CBS 109695]